MEKQEAIAIFNENREANIHTIMGLFDASKTTAIKFLGKAMSLLVSGDTLLMMNVEDFKESLYIAAHLAKEFFDPAYKAANDAEDERERKWDAINSDRFNRFRVRGF